MGSVRAEILSFSFTISLCDPQECLAKITYFIEFAESANKQINEWMLSEEITYSAVWFYKLLV